MKPTEPRPLRFAEGSARCGKLVSWSRRGYHQGRSGRVRFIEKGGRGWNICGGIGWEGSGHYVQGVRAIWNMPAVTTGRERHPLYQVRGEGVCAAGRRVLGDVQRQERKVGGGSCTWRIALGGGQRRRTSAIGDKWIVKRADFVL